jgi:hypothetical protein
MEVVIDSCVISSANDQKPYDIHSSNSRQVLNVILENKHIIAVSAPILTEYGCIQTRYGIIWLAIMRRKKRMRRIDNVADDNLRDYLRKCTKEKYHVSQYQNIFRKIEEDIHLLETALKSQHLIISNEKNCRDKIRVVVANNASSKQLEKLRKLVWIRPIENYDITDVIILIKKGYIIKLHQNFRLILN